MNNIKIINSEGFINSLKDCNKNQFSKINNDDFEIVFRNIQPLNGYEHPKDQITTNKFPFCCEWHTSIYDTTKKWFDKFPNCCPWHKKLNDTKWFKKNNYKDVLMKVVKQLSYTEHCISENINSSNWYKAIIDYIEWNVYSFGQLPKGFGTPIGLEIYLDILKQYISLSESSVPKEKAQKIIGYIDSYFNINKEEIEPPDVNALLETYKEWLKIFPFEVSYFTHLKKKFESQWPILMGKPEINIYTNIAKSRIISKQDLIELLLNLTNNILSQINSYSLLEKGQLAEPKKIKLELVLNERKLKLKQGYINNSQNEEPKYKEILIEWFKDEKKFIEDITPLLSEVNTLQINEIKENSKIIKIKTGTIIDWWANHEIGLMLYNKNKIWYQFIRQIKSGKQYQWEVSKAERTTENCPIITKGIIAFILENYGKSEKEIFDNYYKLCFDKYKKTEAQKPGSSMKDLDSEFYPIHVGNEKLNIDFSRKLNSYLSDEEMNQLNQYAKSYLQYIDKSFSPQPISDNKTNELSVADWSIVFYYLYTAEYIKGVKTEQMEKFIESNNVLNPQSKKTTVASFRKEEFESRNRINGKENKYGELEWTDRHSPLPPDRIKKILPFIEKSKIAHQTAKDDIDRLQIEYEQYKEKDY